jgi:hypothetical protein
MSANLLSNLNAETGQRTPSCPGPGLPTPPCSEPTRGPPGCALAAFSLLNSKRRGGGARRMLLLLRGPPAPASQIAARRGTQRSLSGLGLGLGASVPLPLPVAARPAVGSMAGPRRRASESSRPAGPLGATGTGPNPTVLQKRRPWARKVRFLGGFYLTFR